MSADAQTRRRADAQTRRRADAQTRRRADAQTRRRADAQTRRRADAQTRRRADAQTRRRADAQTRRRADAQARRRADAQTRRRADAQTRRRADAQTRRRADAQTRRRADAQTRRRADAQTRRRADAQTRRRADAQTRRRADAQTRRRADAQTRRRADVPSGVNVMSEPFNIERGVLQGDIFSPVSFIAGLDKIFRAHDVANSGVVVGNGDSSVLMAKFEYADDAALIDGNTTLALARVTALAEGSLKDAAMVISVRKSKAMHVHRTRHMDAATEEDVAALSLAHKCESCGREFTKQRGLKIHMARWCDGGRTQRSRRGSLTDTEVKTVKRREAEATLDKVSIGDDVLDNVFNFEYLGSRLQRDGDDQVDVRHRMDIAQAAFGSLSHLWTLGRRSCDCTNYPCAGP